jgi:hypothetical protein|nr:MAG TPA: endonuclease [Caudoviricetes sp.]
MRSNGLRIGGSDIPTLLGINPFKDLYTLLLEKCKFKEVVFEDNDFTLYGKAIEPLIRDYLNSEMFKDNPIAPYDFWENELGFVSRTDGKNTNTIVEIKSTSVTHNTADEYMNYLCQLIFYIWRLSLRDGFTYRGVLAIYERPKDFRNQLPDKVVFDPSRLQVFEVNFDRYQDNVLVSIKTAIDNFDYYANRLNEDPFLTESELFGTNVVIE